MELTAGKKEQQRGERDRKKMCESTCVSAQVHSGDLQEDSLESVGEPMNM